MTIDTYLTAAGHIADTAELAYLKVQQKEGSADAYLLQNRISLAEKVLETLPEQDVTRIREFEALLTSRINTKPTEAESYVKVARYLQQDALLCRMIAEGKGESSEADDLRDNHMDRTSVEMAYDPEFKIHTDGLDGLHGWIGNGYGIWDKK